MWAPLLPCLNIGNTLGSDLNTCYISINEEHVNIRDQIPSSENRLKPNQKQKVTTNNPPLLNLLSNPNLEFSFQVTYIFVCVTVKNEARNGFHSDFLNNDSLIHSYDT